MSDDIVARLRLYANASIDGGWASVFRADLNIAADEIERLRKERDEAGRLYINEMCLREYGDTSSRISEAKSRGWDCFEGFKK